MIIEITIIRTSNTYRFSSGWRDNYQSFVSVTGGGVDINLTFIGITSRWWWVFGGTLPDQYMFSVERTVGEVIPLETLLTKNDKNNALNVGILRYHSYFNDNGTVSFSSLSTSVNTNFFFSRTVGSTTYTFPYKVAFESTKPSSTIKDISLTNSFVSTSDSIQYPNGGGSGTIQVLEGIIKVFVTNPNVIDGKPPGEYSSTIYCLLSVN